MRRWSALTVIYARFPSNPRSAAIQPLKISTWG
jgi:hypothetical protein